MATVTNFVKQLFSVSSPFTLQNIVGFPYMDWLTQQGKYEEYESWYSGEALSETIVDAKGNRIDKFPLRLNPIPNTCEKHTSLLLGNTLESIRYGGVPVTFVPKTRKDAKDQSKDPMATKKPGSDPKATTSKPEQKPQDSQEPKDPSKPTRFDPPEPPPMPEEDPAAQVVTDALVNAFLGGGGGSLFVSNAILSQYLGGCVFGVSYKGKESEKFPVQVVAPLPQEFIGFPKGNNFWELREAWFVREISWMDALAYGYPVPETVQNAQMSSDAKNSGYNYWYIEHWTEEEYSIQVNEMVINLDGVALAGINPFGIVPFVYIPHIRTNKFLGNSMINEHIKGVIKEMNARNRDVGDAVQQDSHSEVAIRGVRGSPKTVKLPSGRIVTDLGSAAGLGTAETQPDMIAVRTQSAAQPQLDFLNKLDQLYRIEAKHPAVADGLDEGSQRSSLTLTTRMWPMQSHVELERIEWTTGLLALAKVILKVCATKSAYDVTEENMDMDLVIKWSTMLPRDRAELVNEISIRKKDGLGSLQHLIGLFGDVDNVEEEIALIKGENAEQNQQKLAEMQIQGDMAMQQNEAKFGAQQKAKGDPKSGDPQGRNFAKQSD
jgi:hypothetical protein